jgi:hypothetical protein
MSRNSGKGPWGKIVGSVVGVGVALHLLHEVADGYSWAYEMCRKYGVCRLT